MKKILIEIIKIVVIASIVVASTLYLVEYRSKHTFKTGTCVLVLPDSTVGYVLWDMRPFGTVKVRYKDQNGVYHTDQFTANELVIDK